MTTRYVDTTEYRDIELAKHFFNGEKKAFEEVFYRYHNRLYVYCMKFIDDQEEAKDIAIQTINKLFKKHTDFDNMANIRAFLFVAARNRCFDYLRHIKLYAEKNRLYFSTLTAETETTTDQYYGQYLNQLRQLIETLPERSREVIRLLYIEGLKHKAIAERLNISPKTVGSQRDYGVMKLKKALFMQKELASVTK